MSQESCGANPAQHSQLTTQNSQLFVLYPVPRVLVEERQGFERAHPIEEENPVQMVGLVLNDAGREVLGSELETFPPAVERADGDRLRAWNAPANVGNAE